MPTPPGRRPFQKFPPISAVVHHRIFLMLRETLKAGRLLDMGGIGRMRSFFPPDGPIHVRDANKKQGLDACALPYPDSSFDAVMSCATLEHIHAKKQNAFLLESLRLSKGPVIHWFPAGDAAKKVEKYKKRFSWYDHDAAVVEKNPMPEVFDSSDFLTIQEHLVLLAALHPAMNCRELYAYAHVHRNDTYGVLLVKK